MLLDVFRDEAIFLGVDLAGAGGELEHELFRHRRDRPGGVAVAAAIPRLPLHSEQSGEVVGDDRLVQFGERDGRGVHRPPIQRPPPPVQRGLHFVRHDDVRVKVRVGTTGVVVVIGGRGETEGIDLRDRSTVGAGHANTGRGDFSFHEVDHLGDRRVMRFGDERLGSGVSDRPQHRRRLRQRERVIVSRDGLPRSASVFFGLDLGDRFRTRGRAEIRVKSLDTLGDALGRGLVHRVGAAERVACHRVAAHPDEELELLLRYLLAGSDATFAELGEARAEPAAGRIPDLGIVASQRRRKAPVAVACNDGAQQILVAVTGAHHAHRNRHIR